MKTKPQMDGRSRFLWAKLVALLCLLGVQAMLQPAVARAQSACCVITAIDARSAVVSAKVSATGAAFQFKVTNPKILAGLRLGLAIYANFTTRQVSLDGKTMCCVITSGPQPLAAPAPAPVPVPKPAAPAVPSAPAVSAAAIAKPIAPVCATATSIAFMKVDGLQGESIDACHKGEVELLSTTADGHNFSIVKRIDSASPRLWLDCMAAMLLPQVKITLFTSGSSPMKVIYLLTNATITSIRASASPGPGTQETITLTAAKLFTSTEKSATAAQPSAQPPPVQISLVLGNPPASGSPSGLAAATTTNDILAPAIPVNALSVQIASKSTTFVLQKAIDSASPQFAKADMTKQPFASVVITIQRNSGKLTLTLINAVVANDVESSGTNQSEQVTLIPSELKMRD